MIQSNKVISTNYLSFYSTIFASKYSFDNVSHSNKYPYNSLISLYNLLRIPQAEPNDIPLRGNAV